ncbi:MAG: prephenate dehydrogenase/arogenate dehydrogenase family protein [Thiogranum sp.]|jgi:prephenate dehydrogenase
MISRILILGINGGFGALFSRLLVARGISVVGADLAAQAGAGVRCDRYISCDLGKPSNELKSLASQSDTFLFCVPEQPLVEGLRVFADIAAPGSLFVDTLSIKTPVATIVSDRRNDVQHLSINPMFAPDIGFSHQNVAAVPVVGGDKCDEFAAYMRDWGANVISMDVVTHDRQTAITQALTHAVTIAFGDCLSRLGYDAEKAWSISAPPHRLLMTLYTRILSKDPDVYWEIQADNPYASEARVSLIQALQDIESISQNRDRNAFHRIVMSGKSAISAILPTLNSLAEKIFGQA